MEDQLGEPGVDTLASWTLHHGQGRRPGERLIEAGGGSAGHRDVVVAPEVIEVPDVRDVGATLPAVEVGVVEVGVVEVDMVEVGGAAGAVEVVEEVVAGAEVAAAGSPPGPEPPWPLVLAAEGGRTWRYRMSTATNSSDSSRVEVRTLPCSSVAGSRRGIRPHPAPV
jgi:hypothetical protein